VAQDVANEHKISIRFFLLTIKHKENLTKNDGKSAFISNCNNNMN
jgi:hypothetical protein